MRHLVWLILLASIAARADEAKRALDGDPLPKIPPRVSAPDESPTANACTLAQLLDGRRCTWEFDPAPGDASPPQAQANAKLAAEAAKACKGASITDGSSLPDPALQRDCERQIARVSLEECSFDGRFPFSDGQGRLAARAQPCIESLLHVVTRTQESAAGVDLRGPSGDEPAPPNPPSAKKKSKASFKPAPAPNPT